MSAFSRADVVMANLGSPPDEVKGNEKGFARPVVIIQVFEYSDLVVIVPFSFFQWRAFLLDQVD